MAALLLALAVAAVAPQVAAAPSVLAGNEDGTLPSTRRCLSASREPVLRFSRASEHTVMLEESKWHSHYIATAIAAIIIKEHLGYDVVFNAPPSAGRTFERAAFADFTTTVALDASDGAQLRALADSSGEAYYMNVEVWGTEMGKKASAQKYAKNVVKHGGVGYDGREGWYMPAWVTIACNAMAYTALHEHVRDAEVRTALETVGQIVDCPGVGNFPNLSAWCPRSGRMKKLEASAAFSLAQNQEIILNNGFNIALALRSPADLESVILSAVNGSDLGPFSACGQQGTIKPFLAYYWEPTVLTARSDLERMLLPSRLCGRLDGGSGTWKCDFSHDPLVKIASKSVDRHAPLLVDFLQGLTVPEINDLLNELTNRTAGAEPTGELYWDIACDWVKRNEDVWITWTATRLDLPGWSLVWDPLNFFLLFFGIFLVLSESLLITGQSLRKRGNPFGWPGEWEVGLPLVPWVLGCAGKASRRSSVVAPEEPGSEALPPGCPLLWASSVFYGRLSDGSVDICLLRFGDEAQTAKPLIVHISTQDGTMKAGTTGKAPSYEPLDHAELRFDPNRCAAWTSVKLSDGGFWGPELRFRVVVEGGSARGSRSCTCVVRDYERRWPGQTLREPKDFSVLRNLGFAKEVLVLVAKLHGWQQESFRLMYCVVEALYDTIGSNYLFAVYVIKNCIADSNRVGLFYAAAIHGIVLCFKRCKSWRFTVSGTVGLRLAHKTLATIKAFDSGMDPSHQLASSSHLFSLHTKVVDESLPVFYTAAYDLLDDFITIVAAPIYIVAMGTRGGLPAADLARLMLFTLVPLFLMIGISAYAAVLRKKGARDRLLEDLAQSHDTYMDHLDQATEMRPMISLYGQESAYDPAATLHKKGTMHYTKPMVQYIFFRMDTIFMLDAVGTCTYAAALVALALLHIDSKDYGSCRFDLSHLLMSLQLFTKVKASLLGLSVHWLKLYEGFHLVVDLGEYLNLGRTATERLAAERAQQLKRLPLDASLPCGDFKGKMTGPLSMRCKGAEVPLGRTYLMQGQNYKTEDFVQGLAGSPHNSKIEVPAFVRVLQLVPGLPLHFEADDDGMLLAPELLAFAEPGRFTPHFAESLRSAILSHSEEEEADPVLKRRSGRGSLMAPDHRRKLKVRAQQLTQALLADPEVLILDDFTSGVPMQLIEGMLRAALDWQQGGPDAVLGHRVPTGRAADAGVPAWLCSHGGVRRTLVLHARPELEVSFGAMLEHLPRIDVESSVPCVLEPGLRQAAANEQGEAPPLVDGAELPLLPGMIKGGT